MQLAFCFDRLELLDLGGLRHLAVEGAKMRESIALAVAVTVRCEYSAPARQAYARLSKIAESKPAFRRRNNCAVAGIQQDPGSPATAQGMRVC
jgi:hypothetical protein